MTTAVGVFTGSKAQAPSDESTVLEKQIKDVNTDSKINTDEVNFDTEKRSEETAVEKAKEVEMSLEVSDRTESKNYDSSNGPNVPAKPKLPTTKAGGKSILSRIGTFSYLRRPGQGIAGAKFGRRGLGVVGRNTSASYESSGGARGKKTRVLIDWRLEDSESLDSIEDNFSSKPIVTTRKGEIGTDNDAVKSTSMGTVTDHQSKMPSQECVQGEALVKHPWNFCDLRSSGTKEHLSNGNDTSSTDTHHSNSGGRLSRTRLSDGVSSIGRSSIGSASAIEYGGRGSSGGSDFSRSHFSGAQSDERSSIQTSHSALCL